MSDQTNSPKKETTLSAAQLAAINESYSFDECDGHDGHGWYFWWTEYPDEGSFGAFTSKQEALAGAARDLAAGNGLPAKTNSPQTETNTDFLLATLEQIAGAPCRFMGMRAAKSCYDLGVEKVGMVCDPCHAYSALQMYKETVARESRRTSSDTSESTPLPTDRDGCSTRWGQRDKYPDYLRRMGQAFIEANYDQPYAWKTRASVLDAAAEIIEQYAGEVERYRFALEYIRVCADPKAVPKLAKDALCISGHQWDTGAYPYCVACGIAKPGEGSSGG